MAPSLSGCTFGIGMILNSFQILGTTLEERDAFNMVVTGSARTPSNEVADAASRCFNNNLEWTLHPEIFKQVIKRFYRPSVDLFASRTSHLLPQYVSRHPDPEVIATDAFLSDWSKWRIWIYPPVILLPKILNKINADRATALILAPHWPGQPWFPQLLEMLVDYPRLLPQRPHLISLPFEPEKEHPLQHKLHLTVWPVSASAIAQRDFQQRLQEFSCPRGVRLPRNYILDRGTLGQAGVVNGRCVPLLPL